MFQKNWNYLIRRAFKGTSPMFNVYSVILWKGDINLLCYTTGNYTVFCFHHSIEAAQQGQQGPSTCQIQKVLFYPILTALTVLNVPSLQHSHIHWRDNSFLPLFFLSRCQRLINSQPHLSIFSQWFISSWGFREPLYWLLPNWNFCCRCFLWTLGSLV